MNAADCALVAALIADDLVISPNTIVHHVTNNFNKTGSANRAEAAAYASQHGLLAER